jgi:hypothetical protein
MFGFPSERIHCILKCQSITINIVTAVAVFCCHPSVQYIRGVYYSDMCVWGSYHVLFVNSLHLVRVCKHILYRISVVFYVALCHLEVQVLWNVVEPCFHLAGNPELWWVRRSQSNGGQPQAVCWVGQLSLQVGFMMVSVCKLVGSLSVVAQEEGTCMVCFIFGYHSLCFRV